MHTRKRGWFSHIDHDNIRYQHAVPLFTFFFRLLRVERIVLSAELSNSYRSAILAARRLDIPVLICEHGSVVRRTDSCVNGSNIHCAFTSPYNLSMRHPPPQNLIKSPSPLFRLFEDLQLTIPPVRYWSGPSVLVADTLSIRDQLTTIVASLDKSMLEVRVRAHPGRNLDPDLPLDTESKRESLRGADVVVSGISGFVIEALFCGVPTVVLVSEKDAWAQSIVSLFRQCPYCLEVRDVDQIAKACEKQIKHQPTVEKVIAFQDLVGFRKEENVAGLDLF